jgi:hypothetical protein
MSQPSIRRDFVKWDAAGGFWIADGLKAANGSLLLLDTGHMLDCLIAFKPKYVEFSVPMGCGTPQVPPGFDTTGVQLQVATKLQLCFDGPIGLRMATLTSEIALNSLAAVWLQLSFMAEIQQGKIALGRIKTPPGVPTDYGIYHGPLLELVECIDRDQDLLGPRITPPPPPILPRAAQRPQLGGAGVEATPVTEPEPGATGASDVFASFRPAGVPRKPY